MSDLAEYFSLVKDHPEMFRNPPGAGLEILLQESEIRQAEEYVAEKLRKSGKPVEWAQVGVAFKDPYLVLLRDAVRFPDGTLGTYLRSAPAADDFPGVAILPVWQGQVLLIRHFRHATRTWHLEIPRGFGMDPDARQSAGQELREEIGADEITLIDLGEAYPDASADNGTICYFYASVAKYGKPERQEGITDILPTPVAEFERMIRDGELKDGFLLMAYGLARAKNIDLVSGVAG